MWTLLSTFLLLGLGYLLGVVPTLSWDIFRFEEQEMSLVHPYVSLPIALGTLIFAFYLISIPLSKVAKSEKTLTERYFTINQGRAGDYLTRRGSF